MAAEKTGAVVNPTLVILGSHTILIAIAFEFFHSILQLKPFPLSDNHFIILGSATAILAVLLIVAIVQHNRNFSIQVKVKEFEYCFVKEDSVPSRLKFEEGWENTLNSRNNFFFDHDKDFKIITSRLTEPQVNLWEKGLRKLSKVDYTREYIHQV